METSQLSESKTTTRAYWEAEPCGTRGVAGDDRRAFFAQIERERYIQEPFIPEWANFERGRGKRLLEIGVGAGTDFVNWVRHGAQATGVDLTDRAIALTRERLALEGLKADLRVADADNLPFADASFDIVYAYGTLFMGDTQKAVREMYRVLKPGGTALVMFYNVHSITAVMLWGLHCAAKLRPWKTPRWAIYNYLESPGTQAYSKSETREMFSQFESVNITTQLGSGDLLVMRRSAKYQGLFSQLVWQLYPRAFVRRFLQSAGMGMCIEATR